MKFQHITTTLSFSAIFFVSLLCVSSELEATHLVIGGSGTDLATMRLLSAEYQKLHPSVNVEVLNSIGSSGGVRALRDGKLDIAITSRALKANEKSVNIHSYLYARTALVYATATSNPINNVTHDELKNIYSGAHPYWSNGKVARPVLRPESDSDTMLVRKHLTWMNESLTKAYSRRGVPMAITDQDSATKIASIPGAIGTSTLALILAENKKLKPLKINGVEPSVANITNNTYTMVKNLYLVINTSPRPKVKSFLEFFVSQPSQQLLEKTGHKVVPIKLWD